MYARTHRGGHAALGRPVGAARRAYHHPKEALINLPNAPWQMCAEKGTISGMKAESSRKGVGTNWEQIRTYTDLQAQVHRDLLTQNPEWTDADGNCPKCDSYDQRLAELIAGFQFTARKSVAQPI